MDQRIAEIIGKDGCYYFCLLRLAKHVTGITFNPIEEYKELTAKGYMGKDCFISYPEQAMKHLTKREWEVRKEDKNYIAKDKEFEILRFVYEYGHFVMGDGKGNAVYDPLGNSNSVSFGRIESKRIYKMK